MLSWLQNNFVVYEDGSLVVYVDGDELIRCDSNWLSNQLGATVPPTYGNLSTLPIAGQGWQKIFDYWKQEGKVQ